MSSDITVTRHQDQDDNQSFYNIRAEWLPDKLTMLIVFKSKAWKAELNRENSEAFRTQLNQTFEEYLINTKNAFHNKHGNYYFSSKNNRFLWKKQLDNENMKIIIGSVKLEEVPYDLSLENLLNSSIIKCEQLQKKLDHFEGKVPVFKEDLDKAEKKIDELIKQKLELEETLYNKFLRILNAKKEKIRELENEDDMDNQSEKSRSPSPSVFKPSKRNFLSDSEDDGDKTE